MCEELRSRIQELWDRLQVPMEERAAFAPHMTGSRATTRTAVSTLLLGSVGNGAPGSREYGDAE